MMIKLFLDKNNNQIDMGQEDYIFPPRSKEVHKEINLYHEKNFPLKHDEEEFWKKLCKHYENNNVLKVLNNI